jgi:regulator of replication initiation timing
MQHTSNPFQDIDRFLENEPEYNPTYDQVEIHMPTYQYQSYDREPLLEENEANICEKYGSISHSTEYMDYSSSPDYSDQVETSSNKTKKSQKEVKDVTYEKTAKVPNASKIRKLEIETKREAAKKREKEKKKLDLAEIPEKYIPEGYYDADPKQQKKMMQMIRNRLSAQNSRDKKKKEQQELMDENQILRDENEALKKELEESRKYIEELKKVTNTCSTCSGHSSQVLQSDESGTESDLYSPTRRSSIKGIFSTFAFLGLIALVCFMGPVTNFNQKTDNFMPRNLMALAPAQKAPRYETVLYDSKFHALHLMMKNFNDNYLQKYLTNQQEETVNSLIVDPKENLTQNYYKRDLTDRDLSLTSNILIEETKQDFNTSTLYCPSGFEFFSQQLTDVDPMVTFDERSKLINAEHIQLIIPKTGLFFSYENDNVSVPVPKEDEHKYYEILCKVYSIREIEMRT